MATLAVGAALVGAADCGPSGDEQASSVTTTRYVPSTVPTRPADDRWLIETSDAGSGTGGLPPLLVTDGREVRRLADGSVTVLGSVQGTAGVAVGDGREAVVVEILEDRGSRGRVPVRLVRLDPERKMVPIATVPADEVPLYDAVIVEGRPAILYGAARLGAAVEPSGDVLLFDLGSGRNRRLFPGFAVEFFTQRGSAARDVIVTTAQSDLTETFAFHRFDGTEVKDWHDPMEGLVYNGPPLLSDAVLSPAADELAYLSGPDWEGHTQRRVGRWELVVATRAGGERLRLILAALDREVTRLDFDGRWAVISSRSTDGAAEPPLLIDTHAERPVGQVLSAVVGTATIESAAQTG
jgi:hypothetical protein